MWPQAHAYQPVVGLLKKKALQMTFASHEHGTLERENGSQSYFIAFPQ